MATVARCLNEILNPQTIEVLEVIFIYLILVGAAVGILLIVEPISNFKELRYELTEFVHYYKNTAWWWLTTFLISVISLTIGAGQSVFVDLTLLSLFTAPAIAYYHQNSPFSIKVEYRARTSNGRTAIGEEIENIATLDNDQYILEFPITTGSNIDEFEIDLAVPDGVEVWNYSAITGVDLSDNKTSIEGHAPAGRDSFVFELILKKTAGVKQGANLVVLSDSSSGRELVSVRLMP
ncbi:hypothetical protein GJ633_00805 [Halorubrum sp. CBA1125]|uniref:DUF1616 domain-containing protein n=2 Tax=Haloferacaceae TaxID=1644056 RepID=A0ABD5QMM4_9EURY|nr:MULTISPECIES: hypothetical protein [Haloferacales]MUW13353.1 hypothetical protein [Halorubrum sp. CBA1125]